MPAILYRSSRSKLRKVGRSIYSIVMSLQILIFVSISDAIGSTRFHPTESMLLTCSGTRRFEQETEASSDEGSESGEILVDREDSLHFWLL